jgi:hypothetical protein
MLSGECYYSYLNYVNLLFIFFDIDGNEFVEEPRTGMTFNSLEELILYYKKYAKKEGFGVVIKADAKNDSGAIIHITLACGCQGKPRIKLSNTFSKPNTCTKTECKAGLNAKFVESKWCVTSVCIDHNHGLSLSEARLHIFVSLVFIDAY